MTYAWQQIGFASYPEAFGDGADGIAEITGTTTLTRDMRYQNLMVSSSGELKTAGYFVSVAGMLDILEGGVISCDGLSGSPGTSGTTATGGVFGAGAYTTPRMWLAKPMPGGSGGGNAGVSALTAVGAAAVTSLIPSANIPYVLRVGGGGGGGAGYGKTAVSGVAASAYIGGAAGGSGGDSSGSVVSSAPGGAGGGGGGVCVVLAHCIDNAGTIRANGGAGGAGTVSGDASGGNGGGGGAGCVVVVYRETKGSGVGTLSAAGGAAGSGGFGGAVGVAGTTASFQI